MLINTRVIFLNQKFENFIRGFMNTGPGEYHDWSDTILGISGTVLKASAARDCLSWTVQ